MGIISRIRVESYETISSISDLKCLRTFALEHTLPSYSGDKVLTPYHRLQGSMNKGIEQGQRVVRSTCNSVQDHWMYHLFQGLGLSEKVAYAGWISLIFVLLALYLLFSNGSFSIMLTMSSIASMFSWMLMGMKVVSEKSVEGVSMNMMCGHALASGSRIMSLLIFNGYLPLDRTGEGFYQLVELCSFVICLSITIFGFSVGRKTYNHSADSINVLLLAGPAFLCALFVHSNMDQHFVLDTLWAFALYLEVVMILPQLVFFQSEQKCDATSTHFLAAQTCAKLLCCIFWGNSFRELNWKGPFWYFQYVGWFVMLAQIAQLLLAGDFMYKYVMCLLKGTPLERLLEESNV